MSFWKLGAVVFLTAFLAGCTSSERYKMTVEVDTPDGLRTGSAVREVWKPLDIPFPALGETSNYPNLSGEAVVVDIGDKRHLFALLASNQWGREFSTSVRLNYLYDHRNKPPVKIDGPVEIWPIPAKSSSYAYGFEHGMETPTPLFIAFHDEQDPSTVFVVDKKDAANSLGSGFDIRRITVERTSDPVTQIIDQVLPWLRLERNSLILRNASGTNLSADYITANDFKQGANR